MQNSILIENVSDLLLGVILAKRKVLALMSFIWMGNVDSVEREHQTLEDLASGSATRRINRLCSASNIQMPLFCSAMDRMLRQP